MKLKKITKKIEDYTARDLLTYWLSLVDSGHQGFIGNELNVFKELLNDFDVYYVLYGIEQAVKSGCVSLSVFVDCFDDFVTGTKYPKLWYYVNKYGNGGMKEKLTELDVLERKWLPSAIDRQREQTIVAEIADWITIFVTRE